MSQLKRLDLNNIAKGAAVERFELELEKVMENINDPNTKSDGVRQITLSFTIKPDEDRENLDVIVESKCKLCPTRIAKGNAYIGRRNGKLVAYSHNPNQMELNMNDKPEVVREGNA